MTAFVFSNDLINIIDQRLQAQSIKTTQAVEEDVLLQRKDVAKLFSISLVTLNSWMKIGKIPYHKINSRVFFKKCEVLAVLEFPVKKRRKQK